MLTAGTDSYVTVDEANSYIFSRYLSTSAQRTAWEALSADDKEIALKNALTSIECIKYRGIKKDSGQSLSFPRCYKNANSFPISWYIHNKYLGLYCQVDVPDEVKYAQIEEALELASPSKASKDYDALNSAVKSYSVTGLSETFKDMPAGTSGTVVSELRSKRAQKFLVTYAGGVYRVH